VSALINREDLGSLENTFTRHQLLSLTLFGYHFSFSFARSRKSKMKGLRIAVIVLHNENAWERRVVKGFAVGIANSFLPETPPEIDVFSAEDSIERLNNEVLPSINARRKEYAAVVTLGAWVSVQTKAYREAHQWEMPHILLGVQDPVGVGLIRNYEIPQKGVLNIHATPLDYERCVTVFKEVVPTAKVVLLPHDASRGVDGFDADRENLAHILEKSGIVVRRLPLDHDVDIVEQLLPHLAEADVLWSVNEPVLQIHARRLSKICAKNSVLYCASELASVFQGADMGWGDSGSILGNYAGVVCTALVSGTDTMDVRNIETHYAPVLRTNPDFFARCTLAETEKLLLQEVVPLGWE